MTTLIKNCTLIDGSGKQRNTADVALSDDKIIEVGKCLPSTGIESIIDAAGKILAPGFIDTHSHSDISILAAPEATGKISQGITTDIIGNCGLSVFPVSDLNREHLNSLYKNYDIDIIWSDLNGYSRELSKRQPAINIATLCGHNSLRASVLGYEDTKITPEHIYEMKLNLKNALKSGAKGISTGLLYTPGKFAGPEELQQLLSVLPEYNAVYSTHIRSEGDQLIESIEEAITLAKQSKTSKLHISHLKASQERNWHKLDNVLEIIKNSTDSTFKITADRYPYTESMTQLSIILPAPYDSMPDAQIEKELIDIDKYNNLVNELAGYTPERWEKIRLVTTAYSPLLKYIGQTFNEISSQLGTPPHLLCAQAIRENSTGTMAAFSGMCHDNLNKILKTDFVCCGSDESARPEDYSIGTSHPRGFGSMPRFINMQKALGIALEESIRRITSMPAEIFRLSGRGLIAPGYYADLVLFDEAHLADTADFTIPHSLTTGIEQVWVNGALSFRKDAVPCATNGALI